MGNFDSKEIIVKCSLEEMVRHFFKDYVVIWHDPNVNSPENQQYIIQLRQFCEVLTFTEDEKALASVRESKAACYVITSGTNGEVFVEKIHESSSIVKIYVFCMNKEYHSTWAQKYQKISCVETNIQNLINQIKQNLLEWYQQASSFKLNLPAFAPIFNDSDKSEMNNLHRYLKIIPDFENRSQAKRDFLDLSKFIYKDPNNTKLIAEFGKSYNKYDKTQALRWYTRESFLYKVTNNCLRIATSDSIQYCRLPLKDIEQAIKEQYQTKSKHFNGLLYRGAYLSQEEWTSLKENQDKEIEMHAFLSVSKEKNVALNFMRIDPSKKVLITIIVPKGPSEEEQGFVEIEEYSLFPQEREILFNVRSRFTVLETEDEYSSELPCRHLVLLYGAQGLRIFTAEQNPVLKVPTPNIQDLSCCNCTQETPENFILRPLEKEIYYCKNCFHNFNATAFLCVPLKNTPTAPEINVKGCVLMNSSNQFNIPFYGYKCSQCQAKKQKFYFVCTDCSKLRWCESCFTETVPCLQAQHSILLETHPFSFWCEKMSEDELSHFDFHHNSVLDYDLIFTQAEMFSNSHKYDEAIKYYSLYLQQSKKKIIDFNRGHAFCNLGHAYAAKKEFEKALECYLKASEFFQSPVFIGSDHSLLAGSFGHVGNTYNDLKEYAKALEYHFKALDIFKSLRQEEDVATAYCDIGDVYTCQGEYHQALEYYFKALKILESAKKKMHPNIAICYDYIGTAYRYQKEHTKALEYHLKCVNIEKSLHGENHPEVASSYSNIASVFSSQKEYDKALEYYLKCLNIEKSLYGENHPEVAASYEDIASVFFNREEYNKELEYHLKSLNIKKFLYGENHPELAIPYKNIAKVFSNQKEYNNALEYYHKALEISKAVHGEKHPEISMSCSQIGILYRNQKEYTKALEYHLKSLDINKSLYGEEHPDIAIPCKNIAKVFSNQKEYNKALEYYHKALDIRKAVYGENNLEVAVDYHDIANIYLEQKEYKMALEYCLRSVEIEISLHGENHPSVATAYNGIATKFYYESEYGTALEFYWKALDMSKMIYGENSSHVADEYNNIGVVFLAQKEYTKALEYSFKSLEIFQYADVDKSYDLTGRIYLEQKENAKALEYFEKCLEIRKSFFEENSKEIAHCYYNLGKVLNNQGEYNKAEEFLFKAMNIEKIVCGENSDQIAVSYYQLADVYMNQKEHNKALEYCLKSLEIRKSVLKKDHPDVIKIQNRVLEIQSLCL